jgi:adenylate kinase
MNGFILDGFPRTIPQAAYLDDVLMGMGVELDHVIDIHVPDEEIIRRISGRRVCSSCGMSYHLVYNPPVRNDLCDSCGARVIQREDDKEETVVKRLKTYHEQTEPLIEYYRQRGKLLRVVGQEKIEDTTGEVLKALGVVK